MGCLFTIIYRARKLGGQLLDLGWWPSGNNRCSYKAFLDCNPRDYDGKDGAVALTRWVKKIESVIENSGCAENQEARGNEAAIGMSWVDFKAFFMEEFCPSNEMEKLESELWNHTMVGVNHAGYTDRFHELAKLVSHLVTQNSKRIERYINGLAPQTSASYSKPDYEIYVCEYVDLILAAC
nr:reverse transcriptase domain-containing protein [Tanacetum cinerariifolium]